MLITVTVNVVGTGPFPGVIDLYGTTGGLNESRASLLASRGFSTLALAYFNYKDLPKTLPEIGFDYFQARLLLFNENPTYAVMYI